MHTVPSVGVGEDTVCYLLLHLNTFDKVISIRSNDTPMNHAHEFPEL